MTTAQVNGLNVGLMVASLAAAFALPFEVFLFSYAVLGPLHYLTEISWLHDRGYFTNRKNDYWVILLCTGLVVAGSSYVVGHLRVATFGALTSEIIFVAFGGALIFVCTKRTAARILGSALLATALLLVRSGDTIRVILALYLPTLIHVFIFTGLFILYGALKGRSRSGHISFGVFVACAVICFAVDPVFRGYEVGETVMNSYAAFVGVNVGLAKFLHLHEPAAGLSPMEILFPFSSFEEVFTERAGIRIMRFIAFAYTYHYLNWFSKTSIIRWHKVPHLRFLVVVGLWILSLLIYGINYSFGLRVLFLLSLAHVLLEFPLNHRSILGIGQELSRRVQSLASR